MKIETFDFFIIISLLKFYKQVKVKKKYLFLIHNKYLSTFSETCVFKICIIIKIQYLYTIRFFRMIRFRYQLHIRHNNRANKFSYCNSIDTIDTIHIKKSRYVLLEKKLELLKFHH